MSLIDRVVLRPLGDDPPKARLMYGQDVRESLQMLDAESVQTVCTSPPYWGLRDYGGEPPQWADGWKGHLGQEPTPQQFVTHLVEVFEEVRRVLHPSGTVWLNLGDCYMTTSMGVEGIKQKDLMGIPWRVALALQDAGWWLRADIIWTKNNPMPSSVRDRPTTSHEYIFLLAKSKDYFYDQHAIREPQTSEALAGPDGGVLAGRNKRTTWQVNTKPYPGAHFATWPEELVEPMVKAGSSEHGCCSKCRAPYQRVLEVVGKVRAKWGKNNQATIDARLATMVGGMKNGMGATQQIKKAAGWEPTCTCEDATIVPCIVLDPFSGSATTGAVALRLGRDYVGTDLQADYIGLAEARLLGQKAPKKGKADPDVLDDLFD